jgi:hypothetical protein
MKPVGAAGSSGSNSRPSRNAAKRSSTSPSMGKRCTVPLEKMSVPFTITSNWPVLPGLISASSPKRDLSDAARLAARGL